MTKEELIKALQEIPDGSRLIVTEYHTAKDYIITHIEDSTVAGIYEIRIQELNSFDELT